MGTLDPALESEDGPAELSSVYCDFCDTGAKRSLRIQVIPWVGNSRFPRADEVQGGTFSPFISQDWPAAAPAPIPQRGKHSQIAEDPKV